MSPTVILAITLAIDVVLSLWLLVETERRNDPWSAWPLALTICLVAMVGCGLALYLR